jgi:putative Mg2+ transporter-C (MgtC) family protein
MELFYEYLTDVFLPLLAASIGGAVLGWEREARDKPAGLRTHMLVSLAAACFLVATTQYIEGAPRNLAFLRVDPAGVIAGIIGGVGFLGAGTIIEARRKVYGITTAASIWVAAAIGTASGLKMYAIVTTAVALSVAILLLIGLAETRLFASSDDDSPDEKP